MPHRLAISTACLARGGKFSVEAPVCSCPLACDRKPRPPVPRAVVDSPLKRVILILHEQCRGALKLMKPCFVSSFSRFGLRIPLDVI